MKINASLDVAVSISFLSYDFLPHYIDAVPYEQNEFNCPGGRIFASFQAFY